MTAVEEVSRGAHLESLNEVVHESINLEICTFRSRWGKYMSWLKLQDTGQKIWCFYLLSRILILQAKSLPWELQSDSIYRLKYSFDQSSSSTSLARLRHFKSKLIWWRWIGFRSKAKSSSPQFSLLLASLPARPSFALCLNSWRPSLSLGASRTVWSVWNQGLLEKPHRQVSL